MLDPGTVMFQGNTSDAKGQYESGDTVQCGGGNSNEEVYTFTPSSSGYVQVTVQTGGHDPSVYVRSQCGNQNSRIACAGSLSNSVKVNFNATAGVPFSVFVDGFGLNNQAGAYTLIVKLTPSVCGDGTIDPGEQCDDSNTNGGDGCDASCKIEPACLAKEAATNTKASPQIAPAACSLMTFFPATLNPSDDDDWYCVQAKEGQTITAQTFTGGPGLCSKEPNNTLIELFKGTPGGDPNSGSCFTSDGLECNDNISFSNQCSRISYTVPPGAGGEYCTRVRRALAFGNESLEYGLQVTVK
jgi:cysteine-rich repeat protein